MIRAAPLLFLAMAAPVAAAERRVGLAGFDRVRVAGPLEVRVAEGSPGARVSGDPDDVDRVELRLDGSTLTVRTADGPFGPSRRPRRATPVTILLTATRLSSVATVAGGRVAADRMEGARIDLAVTGAGGISVAQAAGDELVGTLIGDGAIEVAGRVGRARLASNGAGRIEAARLEANDLTVRQDGPGRIAAAARYTAQVSNAGLGSVAVAGRPKCRVTGAGSGTVTCGAGTVR